MIPIRQRQTLARLACGPVRYDELRHAGRAVRKLIDCGWARPTPNPFSGYEITEEGRECLRQLIANAEATAGAALGNHNEAHERGDAKRAEFWLARSQKWLDEANMLRNWGD